MNVLVALASVHFVLKFGSFCIVAHLTKPSLILMDASDLLV